jgi:hypothetical protein
MDMSKAVVGDGTEGITFTAPERLIFQRWMSGVPLEKTGEEELRVALRDIGIYSEPEQLYTILDAGVARLMAGWWKGNFTVGSTDEDSGDRAALPSESLLWINWANGSVTDWPD